MYFIVYSWLDWMLNKYLRLNLHFLSPLVLVLMLFTYINMYENETQNLAEGRRHWKLSILCKHSIFLDTFWCILARGKQTWFNDHKKLCIEINTRACICIFKKCASDINPENVTTKTRLCLLQHHCSCVHCLWTAMWSMVERSLASGCRCAVHIDIGP